MLDRSRHRLGRKRYRCGRSSSTGGGGGGGAALASSGLRRRGRGWLRGRLLWGLLYLLGLDSGGLRMRDMVLLLDMLRLDMLLVRRGLGLLLNVLGMLLRMLVHMLRLDMLGMLRMLLLRRVLRHGHGRLDGALVLLLLMVLLGRGLLGMWGGTVGAVVGSLVAAIQVRLGILVLLSAVPGIVSKGRLLLRLHRIQRGLCLRRP